jgi:hypothetical protein
MSAQQRILRGRLTRLMHHSARVLRPLANDRAFPAPKHQTMARVLKLEVSGG